MQKFADFLLRESAGDAAAQRRYIMRWWEQPSTAPVGLPCPGGATFRVFQSWPSGFRAAVVMAQWVPDRIVRLHFGRPPVPSLGQPVGATPLDAYASFDAGASSVAYVLGPNPGVLAPNAFDLQARSPLPAGEDGVVVTCDLPYPPPPAPSPAPSPSPSTCSAATISVVDSWLQPKPGYELQLTVRARVICALSRAPSSPNHPHRSPSSSRYQQPSGRPTVG